MPRHGKASRLKQPGTAIDPRNGQRATLAVVVGERFDPPTGLGERALAQWEAYWTDPVSQLITPADHELLIRWIIDVDRYHKVTALADKNPLQRGSKGQDAINPLYPYSIRLQDQIKNAEAQLGIGPKNRAALGIAVITEQRSLADLNRDYEADDTDLDSGEDDPRLKIVRGRIDA